MESILKKIEKVLNENGMPRKAELSSKVDLKWLKREATFGEIGSLIDEIIKTLTSTADAAQGNEGTSVKRAVKHLGEAADYLNDYYK